MLLAVPKYGRVKVNKILHTCRISPSKTIGGLSERQRSELVGMLRVALSPRPVFVITGPSGVGKGTLIRGLRERVPELELSVSATTRPPRPGEEHGVDYHFLSDAEFDERLRRGRLRRARQYSGNRYGTLRSELDAARRRRRPGRARDRGPGRAPDPRGDARGGAGLHRPAVAWTPCGSAWSAAAPTTAEDVERRLRDRPRRARGARTSSPTSSSTIGSRTAVGELERIVRAVAGPAATLGPRDQATHRRAARQRRLELRLRDRRRQARAPDQLLLPQPRRGHVRRVPAADGRDRDRRTTSRSRSRKSPRARSSTTTGRSGGSGRGAAAARGQRRASPPTRRWSWCGWPPGRPRGARGADRRRASASSARASFAGLTGAPVLVDEFERDPARGAFPDQAPPDARPALATSSSCQRRRLPHRAGLGEHDRQARPRAGRQPPDHRRARRPLPAARGPGDEQPHVGAPGDAGQRRDAARARRRPCSSPAPARWARKGEWGAGRLPEPPELLAAVEALVAPAAADARWTGCACSSPPAAPASRSTRCASSATAPPGAWASRWPTRPRAAAPR